MRKNLWEYDPSVRCYTLLRKHGIRTPAALHRRSLDSLSKISGVGRATLYELSVIKQLIELEESQAPVADQAVHVARVSLQRLTECGTQKSKVIAIQALLEISEILAGDKH